MGVRFLGYGLGQAREVGWVSGVSKRGPWLSALRLSEDFFKVVLMCVVREGLSVEIGELGVPWGRGGGGTEPRRM